MIDANVIAHGSTWFSNDKVTFRSLSGVTCFATRLRVLDHFGT